MPAREHVRQWLARRLTGCSFAAWLAQRGGGEALAFSLFDDLNRATAENLDRAFDFAAARHVPAIAVFPGIRTETDLVDLLSVVAAGDRWRFSIEHPEGLRTDEVLIGIRWQTKSGLVSMPMGLAPFGTMPVTRRAPHVCIAAWPGGHENPRWTRFDESTVDFLDTRLDPPGMDGTAYKKRWQQSSVETSKLLSAPPDDANHYRKVAFRLSQQSQPAMERLLAHGQR